MDEQDVDLHDASRTYERFVRENGGQPNAMSNSNLVNMTVPRRESPDTNLEVSNDEARHLIGDSLLGLLTNNHSRAPISNRGITSNDDIQNEGPVCVYEYESVGRRHSRENSADRQFYPTRRLGGRPRRLTPLTRLRASAVGLESTRSSNYRGTITEFDLHNAQINEDQNCSLYVTRIHQSVGRDISKLFAIIRTGKLYGVCLNPPLPQNGIFTCAAFVTFTARDSAERFLDLANSVRGIYIKGVRIQVQWNRSKVGPSLKPEQSRILIFRGPRDEISLDMLETEFRGFLYYVLVTSATWDTDDGLRVVVMDFASIRAQSESAYMCFQQLHGHDKRFSVEWGRDPCDPSGN